MASTDQIRAGDVLLTRGTSFIAWAIRAFDGTPVNHAAIALDGDLLAEAAGQGLQTAPIDESVRASQLTVVRALPAEPDPTPMVTVARRYLDSGVPYAYQQIVLLALLTLTRRVPLPPVARRMLRRVLDEAAALLNSMADEGRQLMICSEYVYRCHDEAHEAAPPDPYRIEIVTDARRRQPTTLLDWAGAHPDEWLPEPSVVAVTARRDGVGSPRRGDPAEAELAPLIAAYATAAGLKQELPPMPPQVQVAVAAESTRIAPERAEAERAALLRATVDFGVALDRAAYPAARPVLPPARLALESIRRFTADPNFVTPGDLLRSPSLRDRLRVGGD